MIDTRQSLQRGFDSVRGGEPVAAERWFRRAVLLDPARSTQAYALGHIQVAGRYWGAAQVSLSRALMCLGRSDSPRLTTLILTARGVARRFQGQEAGAGCDYRRALVVDPTDWQSIVNLRASEQRFGNGSGALARARWAVLVNPMSPQAWNDLAAVLSDADDSGQAEPSYRRSLILTPSSSSVWNNLGIWHKRQHHLGSAIAGFSRAVTADPGNRDAWPNLGRNLLLTGDFRAGWKALERNSRLNGLQPRSDAFRLPLWDGKLVKSGALLLWSDERIGDEILFATQLDQIMALAGRVVLLCDPRLISLFRSAFPHIQVEPWDGRSRICPASLGATVGYPLEYVGQFARRTFADFPPPHAYLRETVRPLSDLAVTGNPRVGLSWRSANQAIGSQKSQKLMDWKDILSTDGVDFFNLQYGQNDAEIAEVSRDLDVSVSTMPGRDQIENLEGFCELVRALDLVITIPNTTAHVAGALGVPTWIMLPRGAGLSWFWFDELDTSLWYPRTRLFRQPAVGDWAPVIGRVADCLGALRSGWARRRT